METTIMGYRSVEIQLNIKGLANTYKENINLNTHDVNNYC